MSSDPSQLQLERNTIFVLTALVLTAIVSISFYNLDRHPAFAPPSDDAVAAVDDTGSPVVFADDPVSLAVFETRQTDLSSSIRPLVTWPAPGPFITFGPFPAIYDETYETSFEESVWTLWMPSDIEPVPLFETASVEVKGADGSARTCPQEADGAHQCGDAGWTRIERRTLTIDGEQEQCIWAHPLPEKTLRIRFGDLPAFDGSQGRLHLLSGLDDRAVGTGVPVDFQIHLGERTVSHRHSDRRGWQSMLLPTVTELSELTIEVSAEDVGRRHICFRFQVR